jgi:hypothetical protein
MTAGTHPLRWLSLVALTKPQMPSFEAIAASSKKLFPAAEPPVAAGATASMLTLSLGGFTAAITLVPRPIPAAQVEALAATAWYWPTAADELSRQSAHLLVTLVDEGGQAVEKARRLTQLTAAAADASTSIGVLWGPGRLIHPPAAFIDQAVQMRSDDLPLFLWIDFRIERMEDGSLQLYTTGLESLGQSELEAANFRGEPQQLLDFAYNIAHYLLAQSKVIRDGDTIGLTDEVQVTARRGPSMLDADLEVLKLEFTGGGAGGSPSSH